MGGGCGEREKQAIERELVYLYHLTVPNHSFRPLFLVLIYFPL